MGNSRLNDKKTNATGFHPPSGLASYCSLSGKVLESKEERITHNQVCITINSKHDNNLSSKGKKDMMPPKFTCDVCGKKYKRKEHAIQHRKLHNGKQSIIKPIFVF